MIYGPDIVLAGLKLKPVCGKYEGAATCCTYCGKPVHEGDSATKVKFSQSFTDASSLATKSGIACGACDVLTEGPALQAMRQYVSNKDGIWRLASDSERIWFFLTPPEPPFVAAVVTSNIGHTVWRTPVTLSKELIYVRVDHHVYRIRRQVLLEAITVCESLSRYIAEKREEKSVRKKVEPVSANPHRNPFRRLSRSVDSLFHGVLAVDLKDTSDPIVLKQVEFLKQLSSGELWALASLVTAKNPLPVCTPILIGAEK